MDYPPLWRVLLPLAASRFWESQMAVLSPSKARLLDLRFLTNLPPEQRRRSPRSPTERVPTQAFRPQA